MTLRGEASLLKAGESPRPRQEGDGVLDICLVGVRREMSLIGDGSCAISA